jgi:FkbM family methyltransferase
VHREYRCLDQIEDADLIIDCGANVGFSSAYFLSRFPRSFVVAIEPDQGNFAALERNLAGYAGRFVCHQKGVWSHQTGLVVSEAQFGDGREWAVTVDAALPGQVPTIEAIDIATVIQQSGHDRVSILKIDIEGAERVVFSAECDWLDRVDNLVIELHGDECEKAFLRAMSSHDFQYSRCDELTVCLRQPSRRIGFKV